MADPTDKKELSAELAAARSRMTGYVGALRHDLDFGARLKRGVARNPVAWYAGAAVIGLLISRIPPARRKVVVKASVFKKNDNTEKAGKAAVLLAALKFGLDFAKPALVAWARQRFFSGRGRATPPRSDHGAGRL